MDAHHMQDWQNKAKRATTTQHQTEIDRLRHQIPHINAEVDAANQAIVQLGELMQYTRNAL